MSAIKNAIQVSEFRELALAEKELPYLELLKFLGDLMAMDTRFTFNASINPEDNCSYTDVYWYSNTIKANRHVLSVLRRPQGDHFLIFVPSWLDTMDLRKEQAN